MFFFYFYRLSETATGQRENCASGCFRVGEGYVGKSLKALYFVVLHEIIIDINCFVELLQWNVLIGLVGLAILAGPKDDYWQTGLYEHGGVGKEVDALALQLASCRCIQIIHDVMLIGAGYGG